MNSSKIYHVNCATFCPMSRRVINGEGGWFQSARLVCHCLILELEGGLALIDTGLGTYDIAHAVQTCGPLWLPLMRPRLDLAETALAHVKRLGYSPEDVRDIVLTHLDFDHAGGLRDFPRATVHVSTLEHKTATGSRTLWKSRRYAPVQWAHSPRWNLYLAGGGEWFGFGGVRAVEGLKSEVLMVPLHGHSVGHCGIAVKTGDTYLFHAGDAYFDYREVEPTGTMNPPVGVKAYQQVYQADRDLRIRNQERLRELQRQFPGMVKVICSHDPHEMDEFVQPSAPPTQSGVTPGRGASGRGRTPAAEERITHPRQVRR
ncbi:MAG TPA: MBL fold metallo-hydrolase [Phycisphaerales bacterium]|nr:MBL fold metallo-hydrolase [Phycisphaerales bacterium]